MAHAPEDIEYHADDTIPFRITVTNNGKPVPLGTIVPIDTATEIRFVVAASAGAAGLWEKLFSLAEITFETDGTDGVFLVPVDAALSALGAGFFHYQAVVTMVTLETVKHGTLEIIASPS